MGYLKATKSLRITYISEKKEKKFIIKCYSNSDWIRDHDKKKKFPSL